MRAFPSAASLLRRNGYPGIKASEGQAFMTRFLRGLGNEGELKQLIQSLTQVFNRRISL